MFFIVTLEDTSYEVFSHVGPFRSRKDADAWIGLNRANLGQLEVTANVVELIAPRVVAKDLKAQAADRTEN
jgi:hypothetical protein